MRAERCDGLARRGVRVTEAIELDIGGEHVLDLTGELEAQDVGFGERQAEVGVGRIGLAGKAERRDGAIKKAGRALLIGAMAGLADQQEAKAQSGGTQGGFFGPDLRIAQNGFVAPDGFDQFALLFKAPGFGEILNKTEDRGALGPGC